MDLDVSKQAPHRLCRPARARIAALAVLTSLAVAACSGGSSSGAKGDGGSSPTSAQRGQTRHFKLAAGNRVSVKTPDKPIATTHTPFPGLDLEVFTIHRQGGGSVVVVFGVHNTSSKPMTGRKVLHPLTSALSPYWEDLTVDGVSLVVGTKQYLPYTTDPSEPEGCVCSNAAVTETVAPGARMRYAAVLAAPPSSVTRAAFVSPLGSIPDLPLDG